MPKRNEIENRQAEIRDRREVRALRALASEKAAGAVEALRRMRDDANAPEDVRAGAKRFLDGLERQRLRRSGGLQ